MQQLEDHKQLGGSRKGLGGARKLLKKYNTLKEKGAFNIQTKIKRVMEKRQKLGGFKQKEKKVKK